MYLTKEEERIYDGEYGWAYEVSMKILVKLGELYGARRLIPIASAHVSGVSYKTVGDAPIEFLRALLKSGGRATVKATTNPSGIDPEKQEFKLLPREALEGQAEILTLYEGIGLERTLTCTPYYLERPEGGVHLSWAESSAVIYANSILNAWTNREGGPSALASALIGKTPDYGLHRPENRVASVLVRVEAELKSETDYGALGIYLGRIIGGGIPLIYGLPGSDEQLLKQLGAAMATSGMTPMFYIGGAGGCPLSVEEKITVDNKSLREAYECLNSSQEGPNMVFIGCPHCSLDELRWVAKLLNGRRVRPGIKLWVCTSRYIRSRAREYVGIIEASGGEVICDTCAIVTWLRELGVETLMTNSAKTAFYAPLMSNVGAILSPLEDCIRAACSGR